MSRIDIGMPQRPSVLIVSLAKTGMYPCRPVAFTTSAATTVTTGTLIAFRNPVRRSPCSSITPSDHIASSVPTLNTKSTPTALSPKSDPTSGIGTNPKLNTPMLMANVRPLASVEPVANFLTSQPTAMPTPIDKKPITGGSQTFSGLSSSGLLLMLLKARHGSSTLTETLSRLSSAALVSQSIRRS